MKVKILIFPAVRFSANSTLFTFIMYYFMDVVELMKCPDKTNVIFRLDKDFCFLLVKGNVLFYEC